MKLIVRKSMDTKQANILHQKETLKSHVRSLPKKQHEELRLEAIEAIKNPETTLEEVESLIGRIKQALYGTGGEPPARVASTEDSSHEALSDKEASIDEPSVEK